MKVKRFEYKGPKYFDHCTDCLYCHGDDFGSYCTHPESPVHSENELDPPYAIPEWCPLPDQDTSWMHEIKDDAKVGMFESKGKYFLSDITELSQSRMTLVKTITGKEAKEFGPLAIDTLVEKTIVEIHYQHGAGN